MASAPSQDPRERLAETLVCHDCARLAPKFAATLIALVDDANAHGYDVHIFETTRSEELQQLYYAMGRSRAKSALQSWHIYGLAADLISASRGWSVWPEWNTARACYVGGDPAWWEPVASMIRAYGLHWGGDWHSIKDCPHVQAHIPGMHESPSDHARELFAQGGVQAVWRALGLE